MDYMAIAQLAAALVAGFFSAPVWAYLTGSRQITADREEREIIRLRDDLKERDLTLLDCKRHIAELEAEIGRLRERIELIEGHRQSNFMRWVKDKDRRIAWFNERAFTGIFVPLGIARSAIEGKTFQELGLDQNGEVDRLDTLVRANASRTYSKLLQLHPDLPLMWVAKVVMPSGPGGEIEYEGIAHVPAHVESAFGPERMREARVRAAQALFSDGRRDTPQEDG